MKIYIAKFFDRKTHKKYAVKIEAYTMMDAMQLVRDIIQRKLGCYVVSVSACPLQEV